MCLPEVELYLNVWDLLKNNRGVFWGQEGFIAFITEGEVKHTVYGVRVYVSVCGLTALAAGHLVKVTYANS